MKSDSLNCEHFFFSVKKLDSCTQGCTPAQQVSIRFTGAWKHHVKMTAILLILLNSGNKSSPGQRVTIPSHM